MSSVRRGGAVQDAWWLAVLVVAALSLFGSALQAGFGLARLDLWRSAGGLTGCLCGGWFIAGAWLRTSWGRPTDPSTGGAAPPLSARTAARLTAAAALCLLAVSVALFVQLLTAG